MKIVTTLAGKERHTTLDSLLDMDLNVLFRYWVENPEHRDFLKGYALVKGINVTVLDSPDEEQWANSVTITFPELELHCDSTGDSP